MEKTGKTLKELVEERKCRKGRPDGINAVGGYWLAIEPILLRKEQSRQYLELRHHRNGAVRVVVMARGEYAGIERAHESASLVHLAEARSIEEVQACLLADWRVVLSPGCVPGLYAALQGIGLPDALDGPDSEDAACS